MASDVKDNALEVYGSFPAEIKLIRVTVGLAYEPCPPVVANVLALLLNCVRSLLYGSFGYVGHEDGSLVLVATPVYSSMPRLNGSIGKCERF